MEMDPWVVSDVLRPNLEWTGFLEAATIHTVRVEDFLKRAEQLVGTLSCPPPSPLFRYTCRDANHIGDSKFMGRDI